MVLSDVNHYNCTPLILSSKSSSHTRTVLFIRVWESTKCELIRSTANIMINIIVCTFCIFTLLRIKFRNILVCPYMLISKYSTLDLFLAENMRYSAFPSQMTCEGGATKIAQILTESFRHVIQICYQRYYFKCVFSRSPYRH